MSLGVSIKSATIAITFILTCIPIFGNITPWVNILVKLSEFDSKKSSKSGADEQIRKWVTIFW